MLTLWPLPLDLPGLVGPVVPVGGDGVLSPHAPGQAHLVVRWNTWLMNERDREIIRIKRDTITHIG